MTSERKKLFIIGAGASKQIKKYLTGEQLLEKIKDYFSNLDTNYNSTSTQGHSLRSKIEYFTSKDKDKIYDLIYNLYESSHSDDFKCSATLSILIKLHNPDSIDNFVQNLELFIPNEIKQLVCIDKIKKQAQDIVANILKEIRNNSTLYPKETIYFYKILQALESELSNISIINFNYDTFLEEVFEYFTATRVDQIPYQLFKKTIEESHVYGDIDNGIEFIRKINKSQIKKYWDKFNNSDDVYFLGFGFDKTNMKNIGLDKIKQGECNMNNKRIYITQYAGEKKIQNGAIDNRRFSPKIISTIEDTFCVRGLNSKPGMDFFLDGGIRIGEKNSTGKVFISGLSVQDAIKYDFNIN